MTLEEIKRILIALKPILREQYYITEIGIFGSYVRGEERKRSDIDILVEFEKNPDLFTFVEIKNFLSKKLSKKVDLVTTSSLKPYLGKKILKGVVYL